MKIIKLGAQWCAPCKAIQPMLESVCAEYGVSLEVIDIDENDDAAEFYAVRSIPTLIYMQDDVKELTTVGSISKEDLKKNIETILAKK